MLNTHNFSVQKLHLLVKKNHELQTKTNSPLCYSKSALYYTSKAATMRCDLFKSRVTPGLHKEAPYKAKNLYRVHSWLYQQQMLCYKKGTRGFGVRFMESWQQGRHLAYSSKHPCQQSIGVCRKALSQISLEICTCVSRLHAKETFLFLPCFLPSRLPCPVLAVGFVSLQGL